MSEVKNPLGLVGIEFTEYATPDADYMDKIFADFGFSKLNPNSNVFKSSFSSSVDS